MLPCLKGDHFLQEGENPIEHDKKVRNLMMFPKIPVGGRLTHFLPEWKKITQEKWVLSVIKEGYKLEFLQKPPFQGIKSTQTNKKNADLLKAEINSLIEKNAIEIVPRLETQSGFYSTLFLVKKKSGKMRPVINLRPLNRYLRKQHFKMETMTKVLNLVKQGDWSFSLDLSDAYLHIPIFPKHRKYLRFCVQGVVYQFKVLCFGPTSAPRVFTKIISVVAAYLRKRGIRMTIYLDDWFTVNQQKKMLVQDQEEMINLLVRLGFIINVEKSELTPTQEITYIGALFKLKQGYVYPTPERLQNLKIAIIKLIQGQISARHYLKILGLIASCLELIPNSRLFMRPIQMHVLQVWSPSKMSLDFQIPCTPDLKCHLAWWLSTKNTMKGRPLTLSQTWVTVTTDASKTGWGGHLNNKTIQGIWSNKFKNNHINNLELEAVFLTIKHFCPLLMHKQVLIRSDNTTVVQYINKQGGTKSMKLCLQTWKLWNFAVNNQMTLKAAHIAGVQNTLADKLSRIQVKPTEWSLHIAVVQTIFNLWGSPTIDLFATNQNRKAPVFCSWRPDHRAFALDALSISWENLKAYAYPPLSLIPKVLSHMQNYQCEVILIAPFWPRQPWYPLLLHLLIAYPQKLTSERNMLTQSQGNLRVEHPNPEIYNLTAWRLSTISSKQKAFRKNLGNGFQLHGGQAHKRTTKQNSENLIAGVINGKLIPIRLL